MSLCHHHLDKLLIVDLPVTVHICLPDHFIHLQQCSMQVLLCSASTHRLHTSPDVDMTSALAWGYMLPVCRQPDQPDHAAWPGCSRTGAVNQRTVVAHVSDLPHAVLQCWTLTSSSVSFSPRLVITCRSCRTGMQLKENWQDRPPSSA